MTAENVASRRRPDYGIDSPIIVAGILAAGAVAGGVAVLLALI